jgi:hypothetical protein
LVSEESAVVVALAVETVKGALQSSKAHSTIVWVLRIDGAYSEQLVLV